MFVLAYALLSLWLTTVTAADLYTENTSRRAFSQPMAALDSEQDFVQFSSGRSLFEQMWVIAPSQTDDIDGLGPLYNSLSCLQCHPSNGRGRAPATADEKMRSMLVRLSIPGDNPFYAEPHPVYGSQLQENAIPGVAAEGLASITYQYFSITLTGGEVVTLRQPTISLTNPGYGDFGDILTSARIGPALIGMGLIDLIDDQQIIDWQDPDDTDGDGISGRVNWVEDKLSQQQRIGRFGYKANIATLTEQITSAFQADLGITSSLFPNENCSPAQHACQQAISGGQPELSVEQVQKVVFYLQFLAIPAPRNEHDEIVREGKLIFEQTGCAACHRPQIRTQKNVQPALFANRLISPYSDFLLHDMGEGLADKRPDNGATGREWKTAPLWGIGLATNIRDDIGYLHDGRARNLLEAILWHGGEAQNSRDAVVNMQAADRHSLLQFLQSL